MKEIIRDIIFSLGADACGFANIDRFKDAPRGYTPTDIFSSCKSVAVFGIALPQGILAVNPRLIYGHFNSNSIYRVDLLAFEAAKRIENATNCLAVPLPCDNPYEYWDEGHLEGRGLLSMKHAAVQAGLGTIGKNTLLLNKDHGNLLTIGAILLGIDLPSDELCENICVASCQKCIEKCPVGAIKNGNVQQNLCRNNAYGKTKRGFDTVDCNLCRTACPLWRGKKGDSHKADQNAKEKISTISIH